MPLALRTPQSAFRILLLPLLLLSGCPKNEPVSPPAPSADAGKPIRLLVIDDPPLAEAIQRVWRVKSEAPLEVEQTSSGELGAAPRMDADAVIYPSGLLGALAEAGQLLPLTEEMQSHPQLRQHEVLDMLRLREVRWGERTYAVSFGSPVLLLAYRKDVLDRQGVSPPATWDEYQRLLGRLSQLTTDADKSASDPPQFGTAEPWGSGWAAPTLLARAAAYARHQDQYSDLFDFSTMKPLIDGPPFVRALEEMVAAAEHAPTECLHFTPHDAYRALAAGKAVFAVCWPTAAAIEEAEHESSDLTIRWAELPGSPEVYHGSAGRWEQRSPDEPRQVPVLAAAGRLGSVTRAASRSKAALHVLALLSGEWSNDVAPQSAATTLYRENHLAAPSVWYPESADAEAAASYAEAAHRSLTRGVWMFAPRLPGRDRYLTALDDAVRNALEKNASPQEALTQAAHEWDSITTELGKQQQINAYQRSLGLEP